MNTESPYRYNRYSSVRLKQYLKRIFLEEKMNNPFGVVTLGLVSFCLVYIVSKVGVVAGVALAGLTLGIPLIIVSLLNIQFGFLMAIFFAYFIFHFNRFIGLYELQTGVLIELLLIVSTIGIMFRNKKNQNNLKHYSSPITFMLLAFFLYYLAQAFNPNALNLSGWLFILRGAIGMILIFIISMSAFSDLEYVKTFTKFWFFIAFLAAIYGIYQEFNGFTDFENKWIYRSEQSFRLAFIWGRFRRMSFLSDAATFGIFMSYTGIAGLILAMGPYSKKIKTFGFLAGLSMFVSMTYSGTRTAYAAVPVGLAMYILMTANSKRTIIFTIITVIAFLVLLFGPFYSGPIVRLRSTFYAEEDASYIVRENNRHGIQPYMWSHPMGSGVGTTGLMGVRFSPGHKLANFPTDSGMVKTALEMGWIGLFLEYGLFFTVMAVGIVNYFKVKNPTIKNLYLMYLACFFAMTIANFAQVALGQRPMNILFYATFALVIKLKAIDDELNESSQHLHV